MGKTIKPETSITLKKILTNMASDTRAPTSSSGRARAKIALKPGFHLVDWVRLNQSASDLSGRNGAPLRKISLKELSEHTSQFNCWTAYQGKVYNISAYLPYHPGGEDILKKSAGKDCTKLFDKYHKWVNCESILGKCIVGTLAAELDTLGDEDEEEEEEDAKTSAGDAKADHKGQQTDSKDTDANQYDEHAKAQDKEDKDVSQLSDAMSGLQHK